MHVRNSSTRNFRRESSTWSNGMFFVFTTRYVSHRNIASLDVTHHMLAVKFSKFSCLYKLPRKQRGCCWMKQSKRAAQEIVELSKSSIFFAFSSLINLMSAICVCCPWTNSVRVEQVKVHWISIICLKLMEKLSCLCKLKVLLIALDCLSDVRWVNLRQIEDNWSRSWLFWSSCCCWI